MPPSGSDEPALCCSAATLCVQDFAVAPRDLQVQNSCSYNKRLRESGSESKECPAATMVVAELCRRSSVQNCLAIASRVDVSESCKTSYPRNVHARDSRGFLRDVQTIPDRRQPGGSPSPEATSSAACSALECGQRDHGPARRLPCLSGVDCKRRCLCPGSPAECCVLLGCCQMRRVRRATAWASVGPATMAISERKERVGPFVKTLLYPYPQPVSDTPKLLTLASPRGFLHCG